MRILVLSDLHLEFWKEFHPKFDLQRSKPDVVVLAGDISIKDKAIGWAAKTFHPHPVLYVAGNHEFYDGNVQEVLVSIESACLKTDNVYFLNRSEFILNSIRFLGCTLWTDFKLFGDNKRQIAMFESESSMNDYQRIRFSSKNNRKLRPSDTAGFHEDQKNWLFNRLTEPLDAKTVVITHMAPSINSISDGFKTDIVSSCYASDLEWLISQSDMWIHGHVHHSLDYTVAKCRVVCNPCGYQTQGGVPQNSNFDPNFIVDI